ncbi:hypothetical protein L9F63_003777, partial [Diploptera punctata]
SLIHSMMMLFITQRLFFMVVKKFWNTVPEKQFENLVSKIKFIKDMVSFIWLSCNFYTVPIDYDMRFARIPSTVLTYDILYSHATGFLCRYLKDLIKWYNFLRNQQLKLTQKRVNNYMTHLRGYRRFFQSLGTLQSQDQANIFICLITRTTEIKKPASLINIIVGNLSSWVIAGYRVNCLTWELTRHCLTFVLFNLLVRFLIYVIGEQTYPSRISHFYFDFVQWDRSSAGPLRSEPHAHNRQVTAFTGIVFGDVGSVFAFRVITFNISSNPGPPRSGPAELRTH